MNPAVPATVSPLGGAARRRFLRRNLWTVGVYAVFLLLLLVEKLIHPEMDTFDVQNLVITALPLAFAATGQAVVVLIGGIDLSVGAMMALVNVIAARWMFGSSFQQAILESLVIIVLVASLGALTGLVITVSRVPDIIVTLATSFIWSGLALWVLPTPGGGPPLDYQQLVLGMWFGGGWPEGLFIMAAIVFVIWVPFYRSKFGLSLYALGSNRTAAYLSGVNLGRTRILAYALGGVFVALAGLALTCVTASGDPNSASNYTLNSVAAVVLGGVSLAGGRGGLAGPIAAAFILTIINILMVFASVDQNWSTVVQGAVVVIVVTFAGLVALRRRAA